MPKKHNYARASFPLLLIGGSWPDRNGLGDETLIVAALRSPSAEPITGEKNG